MTKTLLPFHGMAALEFPYAHTGMTLVTFWLIWANALVWHIPSTAIQTKAEITVKKTVGGQQRKSRRGTLGVTIW
jgi:hypothetical protein